MALETGTYISDLVVTNPTAADVKSQGPGHFQLIKNTLKNTFAAITGAVTATHTELNLLSGLAGAVVSTTASQSLTNKTITDPTFGNSNIRGIKGAAFNSELTLATTTGAVTVDWTAGANYKQTEPTGTITYTFTAPTNYPCRLQIRIDSDGTSTAYTPTFPASVIQYGAAFSGVNNKKAVLSLWYDGTKYHMTGMNEV
jgi:hypothetical protein